MDEKIKILSNINTDDARFLFNVIKAYNCYNEDMENKRKNTKIALKNCNTNLEEGIINLDEVNADKYFYTKMRLKLNHIIDLLSKCDNESILNKKVLHNIIYSKIDKTASTIKQGEIDIVELIKKLNEKNIKNIVFVAEDVTDINLFKEEQINLAIEVINITSEKERIEKIYDYTYNYLTKDFIANNYCDFINNKCAAQRRFHFYPINSKNGCCFMKMRKCIHLNEGNCDIECIACRLFSCSYLTKRGIGYYGSEFILLNAFLDRTQRKKLIFQFYKPKEEILKKISKIYVK